MSAVPIGEEDVNRFIINQIDSVPQLEALLLLWNNRPQHWPLEKLCERLFVPPQSLHDILQDLVRRHLITVEGEGEEQYWYQPGSEEKDSLIQAVDATYRRELVRISNIIHSKAPASVREFARAFKFTKEKP